MEVKIPLDRERLRQQAIEMCSIIADRKHGQYLIAAPKQSDRIILDQHMAEAVQDLLAKGMRFDPVMYDDAIAFFLPANRSLTIKDSIVGEVNNYIVNMMACRWMMQFSQTDGQSFASIAAIHLNNFGHLLNARRKPERKTE